MRASPLLIAALVTACGSSSTNYADLLGPGGGEDGIPTGDADLRPWLEDGSYVAWLAEPAVHPSDGPHFGDVRVFFSPGLATSLAGGTDAPVGAASVKEMYGDGPDLRGWSVMIKVTEGTAGDSWYWYEIFGGSPVEAVGKTACVNCHAAGEDHVLSPLP